MFNAQCSMVNVVEDSLNVKVDDFLLPFLRQQELHVLAVVLEKRLCEDSGTCRVAEHVEVLHPVLLLGDAAVAREAT